MRDWKFERLINGIIELKALVRECTRETKAELRDEMRMLHREQIREIRQLRERLD